MAMLCPASSKILALSDSDLDILQNNQEKGPIRRAVSIRLECKTIYDSESHRAGQLDVKHWLSGETKAIINSKSCDWKFDSSLYRTGITPVELHIHLDTLCYHKDQSPWPDGRKRMSTWSVRFVSLSGLTHLSSPSNILDKFIYYHKEVRELKIEAGFELFANENDRAAQLLNIHRRPLDKSPISEANVAKMLLWIKDCDETHKWCWPDLDKEIKTEGNKESHILPSRLLDVGDSTSCPQLRLIITRDLRDNDRERLGKFNYIALSYCWGNAKDLNQPLKTTQSTLGAKLERIEIEAMPLAFKDAVIVARILGIRYVWIDSLCIIQDDPLDWQIESSRMAEIFSNAYLTVIAAAGASCHDSFLRRDQGHPPCTVSVDFKPSELGKGQFSLRCRRRWLTDKMDEIIESRWITRGWTFQEERLARRCLIFGKNKFFLDCKTLERVEDTEKYLLRPEWVESVSEIPREEGVSSQGKNISQMRTTFNHWQTLCSHYSYRDLTYPGDKLPAISGIASKFFRKINCDYLGGLWRGNLMHDLFWYTIWSGRRPEKYRAPSWSWASLDGRITWPRWRSCLENSCETYCTILEAQATTHSLDPFGGVEGGHLKILGALLELDASLNPDEQNHQHRWRLHLGSEEIATASLDVENVNVTVNSALKRTYHALLFAKCKAGKGSGSQPRGLLLSHVASERDDGLEEFQREGIFHLLSNSPDVVAELWGNLERRTIVVV